MTLTVGGKSKREGAVVCRRMGCAPCSTGGSFSREIRGCIEVTHDCIEGILDCRKEIRGCIEGIDDCKEETRGCIEGTHDCIEGTHDCKEEIRGCIEGIHDCKEGKKEVLPSIESQVAPLDLVGAQSTTRTWEDRPQLGGTRCARTVVFKHFQCKNHTENAVFGGLQGAGKTGGP